MGRMKELWEERRLQDQENADYGAHDPENYREDIMERKEILRASIASIGEELEKIAEDFSLEELEKFMEEKNLAVDPKDVAAVIEYSKK